MAIKALPIISKPIYLGELSDEVKEMEGSCPKDKRAWVIVRQATEADNTQRAALRSEVTVRWQEDGTAEEIRDVNLRELWAMEVYLCLCDAGNILDADDKPLFKFVDTGPYGKVKHGFAEFKEAYGVLASPVTATIRRAVYTLNSDWDWFAVGEA